MWKLTKLTGALSAIALLAVPAAAEQNAEKVPSDVRTLVLKDQRTHLMNCFAASVDLFDDHISPANIVADAVAWHCEADRLSDNYWSVLASRRWANDTVDLFYRDLALPFVLKRRAQRLAQPTAPAATPRM